MRFLNWADVFSEDSQDLQLSWIRVRRSEGLFLVVTRGHPKTAGSHSNLSKDNLSLPVLFRQN